MLEELCKKDAYWRKIAYNICRDRMIADDLVQDMYLRVVKYDVKDTNDWFIAIIIRNRYLELYKRDKKLKPITDFDKQVSDNHFEFEHPEIKKLKWWEKEVLERSLDQSYREIEKETGMCYMDVFRTLKTIKQNAKKEAS